MYVILFRVLWSNRANSNYNYIYKMGNEIYYRKLAHIIMEAEKSHDLPSARWRPREVGGVVWRSESLRINGVASSLDLKAKEARTWRVGEDHCPGSCSQAEREFYLPPAFWSIWASTDWFILCDNLTGSQDRSQLSGISGWHYYPPALGAGLWIHFIQSISSSANLLHKHPQGHTQM